MAQDPRERILDLIGGQIFKFKELVDQLHQQWPDHALFICEQLRRFTQNVQQIVHEATDQSNHVAVESPGSPSWIQYLASANTAETNLQNNSPIHLYSNAGARIRGQDAPDANHEQWMGTSLFESNMGSPTPGNSSNFQITVSPTDQSSTVSGQFNHSCEGGIEAECRPRTINPALLHRDPTNSTPSFRDPQVDADIWSGAMTPDDHSTMSPPFQSDYVPIRDNASTVHRVSPSTTRDSRWTRSWRGRARRGPQRNQTAAESESLAPTASHSALYRSIASPDALVQLAQIIPSIGETQISKIQCSCIGPAEVLTLLDGLDLVQHTCALWRRMLLYRFSELWSKILEIVQEQREACGMESRVRRLGKPESEAKDILTRKLFPHVATPDNNACIRTWRTKYQRQRKSVANRLDAARNWKRAVDRFGLGVLTMIPFGGDLKPQSSEYETLNVKDCELLLASLDAKDEGSVRRLSGELTPFVQAMYNGEEYTPASKNELIAALSRNVQIVNAVS